MCSGVFALFLSFRSVVFTTITTKMVTVFKLLAVEVSSPSMHNHLVENIRSIVVAVAFNIEVSFWSFSLRI
jgi:hypothetical protein